MFFCADLWSVKVFTMLIVLIDPWQVLSYLVSMLLFNQANHVIWQKSWSLQVKCSLFFPGFWKWMPPKKKKKACPLSSSTPRRKKTTKSFAKSGLRNLQRATSGFYYNQEKWLKDDKASEKPIKTTAESSFTTLASGASSFLGRERQSEWRSRESSRAI